MEVLKNPKFQLIAGISIILIVITVIIVICVKAIDNTVKTGDPELLGWKFKPAAINAFEKVKSVIGG